MSDSYCKESDACTCALCTLHKRKDAALEIATRFGGIEGDHHRTWVIDQMVRALTGDDYEQFVTAAKAGEDGPNTYEWEVGIAP